MSHMCDTISYMTLIMREQLGHRAISSPSFSSSYTPRFRNSVKRHIQYHCDLEAIPTGAGIEVYLFSRVEIEILDFYIVVDGGHLTLPVVYPEG